MILIRKICSGCPERNKKNIDVSVRDEKKDAPENSSTDTYCSHTEFYKNTNSQLRVCVSGVYIIHILYYVDRQCPRRYIYITVCHVYNIVRCTSFYNILQSYRAVYILYVYYILYIITRVNNTLYAYIYIYVL